MEEEADDGGIEFLTTPELRAHIRYAKQRARTSKLWTLELEAAEAELQKRRGPRPAAEDPKKVV